MNRIIFISEYFKSQTFYSAKGFFLALTLLFALSTMGLAQKNKLGVRNAHAMVYNQKSQKVLLFGGADEQQVHGDLWRFTGKKWKKLKASGPAPRTFPTIVYDGHHDRIVMFGGSKVLFGQSTSADNLLNDTWVYINNEWNQLSTTEGPSPRAEANMVYDPIRKKIYLFGGYKIEGEDYIKLGDTWELDGQRWKKIADDGASARHGVVLTFHKELEKVFLFGGSTVDRNYGQQSGESWLFDGKAWTKLDINQPSNIFNAAGTYGGGRILRFGGWKGDSRIEETWQFLNNNWEKINLDLSPSARNHSAMVWDEKNKRFLLYGGHDGEHVFGDTWSFTNKKWELLMDRPALKRVANGH